MWVLETKRIKRFIYDGADIGFGDAKMGKRYILNGFSPNMIGQMDICTVVFYRAKWDDVANAIKKGAISAIGHDSTAKIISTVVGHDVPANRVNVSLNKGDTGYIITLPFRPVEGKVYTADEIKAAGVRITGFTVVRT